MKLGIAGLGFGCVFFGYRLFCLGITRGGAAVQGEIGRAGGLASKARIVMERGGPGLVFALFGMAVMIAAIVKDSYVRYSTSPDGEQVAFATEANPAAKKPPQQSSAAPATTLTTKSKPPAQPAKKAPSTAPKEAAKPAQQPAPTVSFDTSKKPGADIEVFNRGARTKFESRQQRPGSNDGPVGF
ncbi:MAG: hypothetical protein EPO68_13820 [Planctomycetota bacterium]|nr:MAG: hypothetical protein EPO68_13820 [Planctomycetota bacterium]